MGHALTTNQTPYKLEPLFLRDEHGHPVLAVLIKGTFAIAADGRCQAAEKQLPLNLTGESFGDDPATSSLKYEPEVAFFKPATDVVMNGHAYAPRSGTTEMMVGLRVGPVQKQVRVCGDRAWYRAGGKVGVTRAATFEKMPLTWERSFGGWDRSHQDPRRHTCELRNPVGVGYRSAGLFEEQIRLPNLEAPGEPIKAFGDQPAPAGFGFVSSHWQPRAALAGTFDERWHKERSPLLPKDFDRRHFNAAPADQVVTCAATSRSRSWGRRAGRARRCRSTCRESRSPRFAWRCATAVSTSSAPTSIP
jgi:hypothetical protein